MADTPNRFSDPFWTDLAASTEQRIGLPDGLLVSVLTKGERSNADQVSEAGARTPFQITPATRKAAINEYGIDPYLNPRNAAEVAGRLLKDSLERNDNNPSIAVAEYHGGTNRDNWGPRTRAYVKRVIGDSTIPEPATPAPAPAVLDRAAAPSDAQPQQSTYDRVRAQQQAASPAPDAIARVFKAYQSGQMTADEAKQFEADVQSGHVLLPRGAQLNSTAAPAPAKDSNILPSGVIDAYASGKLTDDEKKQLESDIRDGTVKLPPGARLGYPSTFQPIPRAPGENAPAATGVPPADPGLVDKLIGGGEAALTLATGATTGAAGMVGGAAAGLVNNLTGGQYGIPGGVQAGMQQGAESLTYTPRTPVGQEYAGNAGKVLEQVMPATPLTAELGTAARAAGAASTAARDATAAGLARIQAAAPAIAERVQRTLSRNPDPVTPTPGTMASGGSAGTDMAAQRNAVARDLPVSLSLTRGQAERTFEQLRFEQETAKDPNAGAPLRERYAQQNDAILKNFDSWVDQAGAEAPSLRAVGRSVDEALVKKAARDKNEIRIAYKDAEKSGEMADPITLGNLVEHLNESAPDAATAPLLDVARKRALQLGIATEDDAGQLVAAPTDLKNAERMRQAIGRATNYEPTNMRQSAIIKGLIDAETENAGGDLYRAARRMRENYAKQYEDRAVIADLLNNRKGMADRKVAFEDVFDHSILKGSLDDVRQVRRVLQTGGDDGKQAWRELQGQTVNWLKSEATKNVATDQTGNPIVSAAGLNKAIRTLDQDGKLDFVFGKQGAQQMRDLNDLAKYIYTAPPGAVNHSNTASVLLAALAEAGVNGSMTGLPVPVLSGLRMIAMKVKDRRIQKRIEQALDGARARERAAPARPPQAPSTSTLH